MLMFGSTIWQTVRKAPEMLHDLNRRTAKKGALRGSVDVLIFLFITGRIVVVVAILAVLGALGFGLFRLFTSNLPGIEKIAIPIALLVGLVGIGIVILTLMSKLRHAQMDKKRQEALWPPRCLL